MGNIKVFDLEEYYAMVKAAPPGKRAEKVSVKGPTKTYYAIRYKGRKEEPKVGERLSPYEKEQRGIEHERMRMGTMSQDALKARAWKITDEDKMRRFYEKAEAMGNPDLAEHILRAAQSKGIFITSSPGDIRSPSLPEKEPKVEEKKEPERELTKEETHEKMRMETMSDKALETRAKKITDPEKMQRFYDKALAMRRADLAAKIAMTAKSKDIDIVTHEELEAEIRGGRLPEQPSKQGKLTASRIMSRITKEINAKYAKGENLDAWNDKPLEERHEFEIAIAKEMVKNAPEISQKEARKIAEGLENENYHGPAGYFYKLAKEPEPNIPPMKKEEPKPETAGRQLRIEGPAEEAPKPKATLHAKGEVVKQREEKPAEAKEVKPKKGKPEPKRVEDFVSVASQEGFKNNLKAYFDAANKIDEAKTIIENLAKGQEEVMSQLRPELANLENLSKEEQRFEGKFRDDDWRYRFLQWTSSKTKWKEIAEELAKLTAEGTKKMNELAEALKQTTVSERLTREAVKSFTSLASIAVLAKAAKVDVGKAKAKLMELITVRKRAVELLKEIMSGVESQEMSKSDWLKFAREEWWQKARTKGAKDKLPRKKRGSLARHMEKWDVPQEEICEECGHPWSDHKHGECPREYPDYEPDRDISFTEAGEPYYKSRTKGAKDKQPRKRQGSLTEVKPMGPTKWDKRAQHESLKREAREARIRSGDYSPEDWEAHEDDLRDAAEYRVEKSLSKGDWKPFKQWKKEQEEKKNGKGKDTKKSFIDSAVKEEWWKKARTMGAKDKLPRKRRAGVGGMTPYDATMIAEGVQDASEEDQIRAWQYLVDSGLAWQLQGTFGRTAADMINAGIINPPKSKMK